MRPRAISGPSHRTPFVERVDHVPHVVVGHPQQVGDVRSGCLCAHISITIPLRSFTGSFAVRLIRCNRCLSAILTCRTNTSGRLPAGVPPPAKR